jgi:hypothetical protein
MRANLRFVIFRVFCRDVPHGVAVGEQARLLGLLSKSVYSVPTAAR